MSIRAVLVLEDHTLDQYIVRPVVEALLSSVGKPHAVVRAMTDPKLSGLGDLRRDLCAIVKRYSAIADVIIVAVDSDGDPARRDSLLNMVRQCEGHEKVAVVAAVNEVEVWSLWGCRVEVGRPWGEIRREVHPKEVFFSPRLLKSDARQPGGGRRRLIESSLSNGWVSLAGACPELQVLEQDVRRILDLPYH